MIWQAVSRIGIRLHLGISYTRDRDRGEPINGMAKDSGVNVTCRYNVSLF